MIHAQGAAAGSPFSIGSDCDDAGEVGVELSVSAGTGLGAMAGAEWLLTNGLGGFAMGTAAGIPSRRYHAYLVAALQPPVARVVALSGVIDELVLPAGVGDGASGGGGGGVRVPLASARFGGGVVHPGGAAGLVSFCRGVGDAAWTYRVGEVEVIKVLGVIRGQNACTLRYGVSGPAGVLDGARLVVRPLVALRDFHATQTRPGGDDAAAAGALYAIDGVDWAGEGAEVGGVGVRVTPRWAEGLGADRERAVLTMLGPRRGAWHAHGQWWTNFRYTLDAERGQEAAEDLYAPGAFEVALEPTHRGGVRTAGFVAAMGPIGAAVEAAADEPRRARARARDIIGRTVSRIAAGDGAGGGTGGGGRRAAGTRRPSDEDARAISVLAMAADDFVVVREPLGRKAGKAAADAPPECTIIAGYPWFADWGRDTLISLPGLLLTTGRFDDAKRTLGTFASHLRRGVVPNRFDDYDGRPHYNTADASLWFLHAATEYLAATGDRAFFDGTLRRACDEIIDHYRRGTAADDDAGTPSTNTRTPPGFIGMDPDDGLIVAGNESTQLTWMDAKRDGTVFTPRHGKPVELSALWHHGLLAVAEAVGERDRARAEDLRSLAAKVRASFRRKFFSVDFGGCFDCLTPASDGGGGRSWTPAREVRCNQILAVSLPHSPLEADEAQRVLATVRSALLTPHGVRTLAPGSPAYRPRYTGDLYQRDGAYHNGTAWPWIIGPYAEAVLRVGGFSPEAKREARAAIDPLMRLVTNAAEGGPVPGSCLGQLPEVYDAEDAPGEPQRPNGCTAQAWSVAEVLRVAALIAGG